MIAAIDNDQHVDASKSRQSDHAFEVIKNEIILCKLASGSHFSEAELSLRYGLARAATRAALIRLAQTQLVQPVPRHGFVVTPITMASIRELFELRLMAEPQAAVLAINKIDVERLRALNQSPQDAQTPTQELAFVKSNRAFHREIALATGNSRLIRLLEELGDDMQRLVHLGLFGEGCTNADKHDADDQHNALIAAFAVKDAKAVETAARIHIEHSRGLAMDRLIQGFGNLTLS